MQLKDLKNIFSVNKTLKLEIVPTEGTKKQIEKFTILEKDKALAEKAGKLLPVLDRLNRDFLKGALSSMSISPETWGELVAAWRERKDVKGGGKKRWEDQYKQAVNAFIGSIKNQSGFAMYVAATPNDLLKKIVLPMYKDRPEEEVFKALDGKCAMLAYYMRSRDFLYTSSKSGSVCQRALWTNLGLFADNCAAWEDFKARFPELVPDVDHAAREVRGSMFACAEDMFRPENYGKFILQGGINQYNAVINGWTDGDKLRKGLAQMLKERKDKSDGEMKMPAFKKLQKQVMSDEDSVSFVPVQFVNDDEAYVALRGYVDRLENGDIVEGCSNVLRWIGNYDSEAVTFSKRDICFMSHKMYGEWRAVFDALVSLIDSRVAEKKMTKGDRKKYFDRERWPLADIQAAIDADENLAGKSFAAAISDKYTEDISDTRHGENGHGSIDESLAEIRRICDGRKGLSSGKQDNPRLRAALQVILDAYRYVRMLMPNLSKKEEGKKTLDDITDMNLRNDLEPYAEVFGGIVRLYNAVEALCRSKEVMSSKTQLYFNNSSFLEGWAYGTGGEFDNILNKGGVLLCQNGHYWLGVLNRYSGESAGRGENTAAMRAVLKNIYNGDDGSGCKAFWQETMNGGARQSVPRLITSKKNAALLGLPGWVMDIFRRKTYNELDADTLHAMLHEICRALPKHPSFAVLARKSFLENCNPEAYGSWGEFCDAFTETMYVVNWKPASMAAAEDAVKKGLMLLFEITSAGLRKWLRDEDGRTVRDMQTINFLDAMNGTHDTALKGYATIYFHAANEGEKKMHRKGSMLVNKKTAAGERIPDDIHSEIFLHVNGSKKPLSPEAQAWMKDAVIKEARFDLVRNASHFRDRYVLHLPVLLAQSAPAEEKYGLAPVNAAVNEWLAENPRPNVLGINRGENNLLYGVVMDASGKILFQRSFNIVNGTNYRDRIADAARTYLAVRDNWQDPDTVADLKRGFIGEAVAEIAALAYKYKAVIALESLDDKFKNDRAQLGQTIYRKFETMLLDKLRWYVPDKSKPNEVLQLSAGPRAIGDYTMGQNGIVFFVSPWGTSSMDPKTGFVNLLPVFNAKKASQKRDLFNKMTDVVRKGSDYELTFDYKKYGVEKPGPKTVWTVSTAGERISVVTENGTRSEKRVYPTALFDMALRGADGATIKEKLANLQGDNLDKAVEALRLTLQMRNCNVGAHEDVFRSPVKGGLVTDRAKEWEPKTTDAVTAYNLARKALWLIESGKKVIDRESWLEAAQK